MRPQHVVVLSEAMTSTRNHGHRDRSPWKLYATWVHRRENAHEILKIDQRTEAPYSFTDQVLAIGRELKHENSNRKLETTRNAQGTYTETPARNFIGYKKISPTRRKITCGCIYLVLLRRIFSAILVTHCELLQS
ncbi:hypothetical protein ANTQUA_LOCUS1786 [Anthophora quadrimaculata]